MLIYNKVNYENIEISTVTVIYIISKLHSP